MKTLLTITLLLTSTLAQAQYLNKDAYGNFNPVKQVEQIKQRNYQAAEQQALRNIEYQVQGMNRRSYDTYVPRYTPRYRSTSRREKPVHVTLHQEVGNWEFTNFSNGTSVTCTTVAKTTMCW